MYSIFSPLISFLKLPFLFFSFPFYKETCPCLHGGSCSLGQTVFNGLQGNYFRVPVPVLFCFLLLPFLFCNLVLPKKGWAPNLSATNRIKLSKGWADWFLHHRIGFPWDTSRLVWILPSFLLSPFFFKKKKERKKERKKNCCSSLFLKINKQFKLRHHLGRRFACSRIGKIHSVFPRRYFPLLLCW